MTMLNFSNGNSKYKIIYGREQVKLFNYICELRKKVWPDFLRLPEDIMFKIYDRYPDFQIGLLDENNNLIAIANSIPIIWNKSLTELSNDGVTWIIDKGLNENYDVTLTNILCAISVTIDEKNRKEGISKILLQHLKQIKYNRKFTYLCVPVRPNLKSLYPLTPIEKYIQWKNKEGQIFDPWLRTHILLGAEILNICYHSASITATINQWEQWTGLCFPDDGAYIIKNALAPIEIDYVNNCGTYIEPNVWVYYS